MQGLGDQAVPVLPVAQRHAVAVPGSDGGDRQRPARLERERRAGAEAGRPRPRRPPARRRRVDERRDPVRSRSRRPRRRARVDGADDGLRAGRTESGTAQRDPGAVLVGRRRASTASVPSTTVRLDVRRRVEQRVQLERAQRTSVPQGPADPLRRDAGDRRPAAWWRSRRACSSVSQRRADRDEEGQVEQVHLQADLVGDPDQRGVRERARSPGRRPADRCSRRGRRRPGRWDRAVRRAAYVASTSARAGIGFTSG